MRGPARRRREFGGEDVGSRRRLSLRSRPGQNAELYAAAPCRARVASCSRRRVAGVGHHRGARAVRRVYSIGLVQARRARHCCPLRRRGLSLPVTSARTVHDRASPSFCGAAVRDDLASPNRTLSRPRIAARDMVLVALMLGAAGRGAQGNVFAPLFAALRVDRHGARVAASPGALVIAASASCWTHRHWRCARCQVALRRFPAYRVRVLLEPGDGRHRLLLSAHGQRAGNRRFSGGSRTRRVVEETQGAADRISQSATRTGSTKVQDMTSGGIRRSIKAGVALRPRAAVRCGAGRPPARGRST